MIVKNTVSKLKYFPLILFLMLFIPNNLKADKKPFARSYTSYTLPARAFELEVWQTGILGKGMGNYSRWKPRIEFEYGITDRLTGSMYLNFNQINSSGNNFQSKPFSLTTTSFEFRYRLSNPSEYFVDPALYFELGYGGDVVKYEPKILLTKRFDDFITVINLNSEIERNIAESENESVFELTAGIAYEINNNISFGLEFRNDRKYKDIYSNELNQASYLGPTVSFQTEQFYFVINLLVQVEGSPASQSNLDLIGHEKYEVRTILGIEL